MQAGLVGQAHSKILLSFYNTQMNEDNVPNCLVILQLYIKQHFMASFYITFAKMQK